MSESLKRLVIHSKTAHFLTKDGQWTRDESTAMDFESVAVLLRTCAKFHLKDAEILFRFQNAPKSDVRVSLPTKLHNRSSGEVH
jgi:hypothetical protein